MTDRYHRQTLLPNIRAAGQARLNKSRVLLVGCGALGTVIADQLVRGGIGLLRICDRDIVELTNLQRQVLFDEPDAAASLPKAIAAAGRLQRINSSVAVEAHAVDVHSGNVETLIEGIDLIVDGTDNVETRYLLNDVAVKRGIPWIYGGCVGTSGRIATILPGRSACLRCLFPQPPGPGELPTCDTAGVLAAAANVVASMQVAAAYKVLLNDAAPAEMITVDLWPVRVHAVSIAEARRPECPTCGERRFEFLDARANASAASLCGRNTVQIRPARATVDLDAIASRLEPIGPVQRNDFFLRVTPRGSTLSLTLFPDGRALIHGTADPAAARSLYARLIGN